MTKKIAAMYMCTCVVRYKYTLYMHMYTLDCIDVHVIHICIHYKNYYYNKILYIDVIMITYIHAVYIHAMYLHAIHSTYTYTNYT